MKTAQDIILAPVITENSMAGIASKKYTFKVATDANKVEIAKAVEKLFGVQVEKVNTINVRGRYRRQEEGCCYPERGQQGHRVLREHGIRNRLKQFLSRARAGLMYGDMTPITIHK